MKNYKFDPSCTNPDNIVVRERYTIEPPQTSNFYFVIPKSAPYFAGRDFKITHYPSGRELQPGTDYVPSNRFIAATRSTGLGVYGSITLLNHTLSGILEITYHTIGGIWTFDEQSILEYLTRVERDPRITSWDSVLDQPAVFPPTLHDFDINDLKGWEVMMPALESIREAIDAKGAGVIEEHMNDFENPHRVDKYQVGLGFVMNYPVSTLAEAINAVVNTSYMTPLRGRNLVEELAIKPLVAHTSNWENPHQTTKAQVGLGLVENFPLATLQDLATMSSNAAYMTPLRVGEAQTNFYNAYLKPHLEDTNNPHSVNKTQVGLGLVENFPMATDTLALQGLSRTHYMSPGLVDLFVREKAIEPFLLHLRDLNNPHGVTKAQVGLSQVPNYRAASDTEAIEMLSRTTLMTPYLTRLAVQEFLGTGEGGVTLEGHVMNHSNPHRVTAAQVGTLTTEQIMTLLADKLNTTATAVNSERFDSMTPPEFIEYVRTNLDLDVVASLTPEQIIELSNRVLRGKADESFNSDKLEGKSLDEVIFMANRAAGIVPQIFEFPAFEFSSHANHHFLVGTVEESFGVTEVTLLVSGGVVADGSRKAMPPLALLRIDFEDKLTTKPYMTIQYLTGHKTDVDFWLSDMTDEDGLDEGIQIWARTDTEMSPLTITNLTPMWFAVDTPVVPEMVSEMVNTLPITGQVSDGMGGLVDVTYTHHPVNVVYDPFHTRYLNADSTIRPDTIPTLNQSTTGRAATAGVAEQATRLVTGRTIAMTGDVTWTSAAFTGAGNVTGVATLANSGVTAGTYGKVTVDAKGRVTAGMALAAGDIPNLDAAKVTSGVFNVARIPVTNHDTTGNAGSATKFQTARTIGLSGDASGGVSFDGSGNVLIPVTLTGKAPTAGAADTAVRLATGRTISMTGDVTWTSAAFTGAGNVTGVGTLAATGVTAGTYGKVTVDAKGRVTAGMALAAGDIPNLDAGKVTSGVFAAARIPTLNQSTTGSAGSLSSGTRTLTPITTQNGGFRMANGTYNLDMYSMPWTPPTRTPPYEGMEIRSVHCFDTTSEGYKFNKVMFTTNLVATSDRRLKRNIRPLEDALTRLRLLNGVIYSMDGNPDAGLLADDVERALPEATVMIPHDELKDAMGVKYNAVVGLLVEAAKGLDQQLSVSEAKRGVLESRVEDLEARLERLESLLTQSQGSV